MSHAGAIVAYGSDFKPDGAPLDACGVSLAMNTVATTGCHKSKYFKSWHRSVTFS